MLPDAGSSKRQHMHGSIAKNKNRFWKDAVCSKSGSIACYENYKLKFLRLTR